MSSPLRIAALLVLLVVLAGSFFMFGQSGDQDDAKDFPPHSVQQ